MKETKKKCELECPSCHETWAVLSFKFGTLIKAGDVKILKGDKKAFKNGDTLVCSLCGFQYSNWDVMIGLASSDSKKKVEVNSSGAYTPHRRRKS